MSRPVSSRADAGAAGSVLALRGIHVAFGAVVALDDVSLEVRPHQVLGIIGPNGAGKSTLLDVVCGFQQPQAGRLSWKGEELSRLRPRRLAKLGIGRTLQVLGLVDRMTVLENVMVGADRHARAALGSGLLVPPRIGRDGRAVRERAIAVLQELRIVDHADELPPALPYAVRKRVALARALVSDPELLLLDEPASGLSDEETADLGRLIRGLTRRMSVILVEHHMELMSDVCDDIVVLDAGKVIARGAPDVVRDDPAVRAAYLGGDDAPPESGLPEGDPVD